MAVASILGYVHEVFRIAMIIASISWAIEKKVIQLPLSFWQLDYTISIIRGSMYDL